MNEIENMIKEINHVRDWIIAMASTLKQLDSRLELLTEHIEDDASAVVYKGDENNG